MLLDAQTCNFLSISCSCNYVEVSIIIYQYTVVYIESCMHTHGYHDTAKKAAMEHEVLK